MNIDIPMSIPIVARTDSVSASNIFAEFVLFDISGLINITIYYT